jgi:hypothetical protein
MRVSEEEERRGLDLSQHAESIDHPHGHAAQQAAQQQEQQSNGRQTPNGEYRPHI